jgi:hypothetical protein
MSTTYVLSISQYGCEWERHEFLGVFTTYTLARQAADDFMARAWLAVPDPAKHHPEGCGCSEYVGEPFCPAHGFESQYMDVFEAKTSNPSGDHDIERVRIQAVWADQLLVNRVVRS